ncbi:MAG: inositol monophosphatase family protein [Bacteriovoracia bacterium]
MKIHLEGLNDLARQHPSAHVSHKSDGSPVTDLDLALSAYIEAIFSKELKDSTFYSEEKLSEWKFPLLALDPLDGTREYVEGRDEWAISLGHFMTEEFSGEGWVYNPLRGEVFTQELPEYKFHFKTSYKGEVSRTEFNEGLFQRVNYEGKYVIEAMGSIAYKLARLAFQNSDFVVSLRPKNIWDIAGGTLLCKEAGLKFYSQGKEVKSVQKLYLPPLIWCHEELFSELSEIYP